MIEQVNGFITPMKEWNAVGKNDETTGAKIGPKSVFSQCLKIQCKMFTTRRRM